MRAFNSIKRLVSASVLALSLGAFSGAALAEDGERIDGQSSYGAVQITALPAAETVARVNPVSPEWKGTPPSHHGQ